MGSIQQTMTPAIQFFLLLTVGQNMMTGSDPVPEPLDELHVHLHLRDEDNEGSYAEPLDHEENHANNKKLLNKKLLNKKLLNKKLLNKQLEENNDSEESNGQNEENGSGNKLLANKWVMPMPMPMRPADRF